jgi:hypothetical protein
VWKVTPRWVVDSEKFNEWMNPADYTTPDFEAEIEAAQRAGGEVRLLLRLRLRLLGCVYRFLLCLPVCRSKLGLPLSL